MSTNLEVGTLDVEPGEKGKGWIRSVELTTTSRVDIPVLGVNGADEGPTVLLFALQHGIELQNVGVAGILNVLILSDVISWSHASRSAVQPCEYSQESVTM